jgi:hypothetical protein
MGEFIFLIRKDPDTSHVLTPEKHQEFLKSCETYIEQLKKEGKLIAAQPMERSGNIVSFYGGDWNLIPFDEKNDIIGGYYLIRANGLDEAIEIAKENPEFKFYPGSRVEVRPLKSKEKETGYQYPGKS